MDSFKAEISELSASQKELKSSIDSISIKAAEKAHQFYKDSFYEIQCSYQIFIAMAGIILAGFTLFTGFSLYKNSKLERNLKTQIKSLKVKLESWENEFNNMKDLFNDKMKEFKMQRNRDFSRNHHFYQMTLDKETKSVLTEFENEVGEKKIIPYLDEFYKRLAHAQYFDLWLKLTVEEKRDGFRKIIEQVDSIWGERLFEDEEF